VADERTPWFPVSVNPVREGWYEYKTPSGLEFRRYFDGKRWCARGFGPESVGAVFRTWPGDQWRGLAQEPKRA